MTAINYVRILAGGGVGSTHFDRPRCEVRSLPVSKPSQASLPTGTAARVSRSSTFRSLRHPSDLPHQSRMQFPRDYLKL